MTVDLTTTQYTVRRVAEKVRRRVLQLSGRPDNSPWIMEPRPARRTTYVDFVFGLDYLSPNSRFMKMLQEAMNQYGLSMLLANNSNVDRISADIENGSLKPFVYLDLSSRPGCPFEKLLYTAHRHGVHAIRNPDHTRWVLKAESHPELEKAGLPLPPTVIFKKDDPDRDLTPEERARVGESVVIKPSFGEAAKGVVVGVTPTRENIAKARDYNRDFDWLVQSKISWVRYPKRHGYLRAYNCFGHRTLLWWVKDAGRDGYEMLTWNDLYEYDLLGAVKLVDKLAEVTGMDYFSTEIAITKESGPDRFTLIDYVNDQCDLDPTCHPEFSPPEPFARWGCQRLAEFVWRKKQNLPPDTHRGLFLMQP